MSRKEERKQAAKDVFPNEGWEFQRVSFVQGALWADKTMIEKACKWLEDNIADATGFDSYALTESFKKAMEE